uniref:NADH-ubiquinone oxidoreductase chain 6 n=1 Tax=Microhodotermes viator TaxID=70922 RepID=I6TJ82_9NEOP|nr:NADH dehydrogenase subunit 6 [Microhodotermes viator]AFM92419.1 NADH dehydrogenase subunit 6 [Microhodotermes viator]
MTKILLSTSALTSIMFTQMKHPLAMGMMLLIQTTIMCMISSTMDKSAWFSYILFLMFVGGMMVLFIYVTSLASNEMFSLSTKMTLMSLTIMTILMNTKMWMNSNNSETMSHEAIMKNETSTLLEKLYNQPTGNMTILMASYLLLTLIVIAKITNISKGPLRQTK